MYKSPIEVVTEGVQVAAENGVYKAIESCGINVDKAELMRALQYDREQYQKGYADGCREAIKEFIEKCVMSFCCGRGDDRMDCYICEDDFFEIMKEMVGE